jgi:hypothetical protein
MTKQFRAAVLCVGLCIGLEISLLPVSAWGGEQAKLAPAAPIPLQIVAAKKIFVANAGEDQPWYVDALYSGGADRTYNQFYAAMKTWGRYELVGSPANADLLVEIGFTAPPSVGAGTAGDTLVGRPFDPRFRLVIRDPKTNALLWAFTEHAQWAILKGNRDNNFDGALAKIAGDLQELVLSASAANKP